METVTTVPVVETPVVPTVAQPPVVVEVEVNHTRGRQASPRTIAIRAMLDMNPDLTFKDAESPLLALGYDVDSNTFNVTKSQWKKAQEDGTAKPTVATTPTVANKPVVVVQKPEINVMEAMRFVEGAGGVAKAEALIEHQKELVKAFKQFVKTANKLAA